MPEFSQPGPPAIDNVEYMPFFFTETCSAHTSSLFWFSMDIFTILELVDMPLIEIISFWEYEDESI